MHNYNLSIVTHLIQNTTRNKLATTTLQELLVESKKLHYFVVKGLLCCLVFSHQSRQSGSIGEAAEL